MTSRAPAHASPLPQPARRRVQVSTPDKGSLRPAGKLRGRFNDRFGSKPLRGVGERAVPSPLRTTTNARPRTRGTLGTPASQDRQKRPRSPAHARFVPRSLLEGAKEVVASSRVPMEKFPPLSRPGTGPASRSRTSTIGDIASSPRPTSRHSSAVRLLQRPRSQASALATATTSAEIFRHKTDNYPRHTVLVRLCCRFHGPVEACSTARCSRTILRAASISPSRRVSSIPSQERCEQH